MPKALLDPNRCNPDLCPEGVCSVRRLCAVRAIYQEEPRGIPLLDWARCRACSKCVEACPAKAISLVN
ncbi:MAG: 4Fe-4S binding protein [Chloroflexi bacterium]|nr:4Fe-4S binding protein [Chloroflexota bacterium]